ncbi:OmpA family protein [Thioclava atlantica]|uniref:OmpA/MotB domain-containing protein n=1 Tax=Thioclava atlantica TaxID=1317124 RepID=A0A085U0J5_9RHOB|nr:OmpA family protein [Thioclava atlantica]KFE36492.1 OmpA/MotB domain-containing protein [Thioclava atlantica]
MKKLKTTTALVAGLAALSPAVIPVQVLAQTAADTGCVASEMANGKTMEEATASCEGTATTTPESDTQANGSAETDGSVNADTSAGTEPAPDANTSTDGSASTSGDGSTAPMSDSDADQAAKAAIEGANPPAEQDPAATSDAATTTDSGSEDAAAKAAIEGGSETSTTTVAPEGDTASGTAATDTNTDAAVQTDTTENGNGATDAGTSDAVPLQPETSGSDIANEEITPDTTSQDAPVPVDQTTDQATETPEASASSEPQAAPMDQTDAATATDTGTDAGADAGTTSNTEVTQDGSAATGAESEANSTQTNDTAATDGSAKADATASSDTTAQDPNATEAAKTLENALSDTQQAIEGEAVQNEALKAPTDGAADEVNTTEETVTEENARSASQDFSTQVDAQPSAQAQTTATASGDTAKKKDGMSALETAAIAGLGALAVGAILNNGSKVAVNSGDRVVVQNPDGSYQLVKDDNTLLRQPGSTIRTQDFADGSSRTIVTKQDGSQIVTVYDAQRRILKRTLIQPDGSKYLLIDDAAGGQPVVVSKLPKAKPVATISSSNQQALRDALARQSGVDRAFTLSQVRNIPQVRALAPAVSVENITFETGSAAIQPDQARALSALGQAIQQRIAENPRELFLVEGHTDAVGSAAYNLALSDRRAESVALALSEYFNVPAENLVVQGYGEQDLKVQTDGASEANRRTVVRNITDLLRVASN